MKALIIAEHAAAAAELVAGARTMADEVVAISFGGAYECGADKVLNITVPEGLTVDSAVETVNAAFDAENPEVVLVEACRHMKVVAGSLAFHADTAVITDVTAFEAEGAKSMYFGGIAERVQKAAGNVAIYTIGAGVFDGAEGANGSVAEQEWVAPARPVKVVSSQVIEKSGVNLFKADVVVAAGRGFPEAVHRSRHLRPDAAHGRLQPLRCHLRHQQGQERSDLQAVRLRSGGRHQGRPAGHHRSPVRGLLPHRASAQTLVRKPLLRFDPSKDSTPPTR